MPNPYHDKLGRFTTGPGGGRFSGVMSGDAVAAKAAKAASWRANAVMERPKNAFSDKLFAGTLRNHQYPSEIGFKLYHGSRADFAPGDLVEPGHPGNFVRRMTHVYAANAPEKVHQYGGKVYEVRPLGPVGHRRDARPEQGYFASEWPYEVVRRVPTSEYRHRRQS